MTQKTKFYLGVIFAAPLVVGLGGLCLFGILKLISSAFGIGFWSWVKAVGVLSGTVLGALGLYWVITYWDYRYGIWGD